MKKYLALLYVLPSIVYAQQTQPVPGPTPNTVSKVVTTSSYAGFVDSIVGFINVLFSILVALSIAYIFYGLGMSVIKGAGSETEQANAKRIIVTGLAGLFVMISILGIINIIVDSIEFTTIP